MAVVVAINRALGVAVLDHGETVPVTNWYDDDGDECSE